MDSRDKARYFNQCRRTLMFIIKHKKYESFSNNLSQIEYSILRIVGNAETYNDLPNCDVIEMLKKIKQRLLSYE